MNRVIKLLLILTIFTVMVSQSAYAYSQFADPTSDSSANIVLENHLIEMGYDASGDTVSAVSRETLVFKSYGGNYAGTLKTWIPDGSSNIFVSKLSHQAEGKEPLKYTQNENIITWEANITQNIATMYSVEYMTDLEYGLGGSLELTRMINHKALPYPTSIFKLAISGNESVIFEDINGKAIIPDENGTQENYKTFSWGSKGDVLKLNGVNIIRMKKEGAGSAEYYMFAILGIVAFIVLLYPFISGKLKDGGKERTHK